MVILTAQDLFLGAPLGISHADSQEEPVELRFWQRISAVMLNGILRRNYHERTRQGVGLIVDTDSPLAHSLEQRALGFRGRAIDFISQNNVGKDGAAAERECLGRLVEDRYSDDVRREKIARELNAAKQTIEPFGQGVSERGLAHPRDILYEKVPLGEKTDESQPDSIRLAADHALDRLL